MKTNFAKKHGFLVCLLLTAMALCFTACGQSSSGDPAPKAAKHEKTYHVTFVVNGDVVSTQEIAKGAAPATPEVDNSTFYLGHWVDESGAETLPSDIAISQDATFTAVIYPRFSTTAAYLFPDEAGFLLPDATVTRSQLYAAVEALAPAKEVLTFCFPNGLQNGDAPVTKEVLSSLYGQEVLFSPEQAKAALDVLPEGEISRKDFAESIDLLLNRSSSGQAVCGAVTVPHDIDPTDPEHISLLDSCIPHEADPASGKTIAEAVLDSPWEEGFHLQNGHLFCADSEGKLLKNQDSGILHFGPDGRYTSGDAELDTLVVDLIRKFQTETGLTDRYELLHEAFLYVRDNMRYVGLSTLAFGETGWENELGKYALTNYKGNCYYYAAAFAVLARGLGYEAYGISADAFEPRQPHGWVKIEIDGQPLFFDPQTAAQEVVYHKRTNWGEEMFAITMDITHWWRYIW